MARVCKDITGEKYGKLLVIRKSEAKIGKYNRTSWECVCDCGNIKNVAHDALTCGKTKSCGCLRRDKNHNKVRIAFFEKEDFYIGVTKKGEEFYIDKDDYDKFKTSNCYFNDNGYVICSCGGKGKRLSRIIMGCEDPNLYVDHINHDLKDNRKANLRICTNQQNQMNRSINKNSTSGYKGVSFDKHRSKWFAQVALNRSQKFLGYYETKEEANDARVEYEKVHFGEYAYQHNE